MRKTCSQSGCDRQAFGRGLCSAHYQKARYHGELPTVQPTKRCLQCGTEFTSRKWNADYCSKSCNYAAAGVRRREARTRSAETCAHCGSALTGRTDKRFCSVKCGQDWRNAQIAARTLDEKRSAARVCRGCGDPIPIERSRRAQYCSNGCKIRSRRHEAYGLTKAELDLLLVQHEACAICQTAEWGKKGPQVDHDHATGRVRGILCSNCNQGLGRFADDPERLRAAARYLEVVPV